MTNWWSKFVNRSKRRHGGFGALRNAWGVPESTLCQWLSGNRVPMADDMYAVQASWDDEEWQDYINVASRGRRSLACVA